MKSKHFNGSLDRSVYDGSIGDRSSSSAARLAYFRVPQASSGKHAPFSTFPRRVSPGSRTRMAIVKMGVVCDLIRDAGAKLFHVSTRPSQVGKWIHRTYQTHVVVVPGDHVEDFLSLCKSAIELCPDRNRILYRTATQVSGTLINRWRTACKLREPQTGDGGLRPAEERSVQVVLAFACGLTIPKKATTIRWVDSYKYKTRGRGNDRRFECPKCPQLFHATKNLRRHFCRYHMK